MSHNYSVSAVMGCAWGAYRAIVAEYPECAGRGQLGVCMRHAWREALAPVKAADTAAEWAALIADGDKLWSRLIATTISVARREIGKSATRFNTSAGTCDGGELYTVQTWQGYLQTLERVAWGGMAGDIAADAYILLTTPGSSKGRGKQSGRAGLAMVDRAYIERRNADRAARGYGPVTLSGLIGDACRESIRRFHNREVKSLCPDALRTYTDGDGAEVSFVETIARDRASAPDMVVITRDIVDGACNDDSDRAICKMLAWGARQVEIAAALGVSQQAIAKRVKKIRERGAEA
ncbi:MAG: hypothetical protein AB7D36_05600 [Oscillospiraceae bacterium]